MVTTPVRREYGSGDLSQIPVTVVRPSRTGVRGPSIRTHDRRHPSCQTRGLGVYCTTRGYHYPSLPCMSSRPYTTVTVTVRPIQLGIGVGHVTVTVTTFHLVRTGVRGPTADRPPDQRSLRLSRTSTRTVRRPSPTQRQSQSPGPVYR